MDDKLFNDIEKEMKEENALDITFPITDDEDNNTKSSHLSSIVIAVLVGILLACIIFAVFLNDGKKPEGTPVFPEQDSSYRVDANAPATDGTQQAVDPNTTADSASIYNNTRSFDDQANDLINKKDQTTAAAAERQAQKQPVVQQQTPVVIQKTTPAATTTEQQAPMQERVIKSAPVRTVSNTPARTVEKTPTKTITPATKTTAKPVAKPTKKVVKVSSTSKAGTWSIQLLSGSDKTKVTEQWNKYAKAYPSILNGKSHSVQEASVNGQTIYRLKITNLSSNDTARTLCEKLKKNQVSCFVTK